MVYGLGFFCPVRWFKVCTAQGDARKLGFMFYGFGCCFPKQVVGCNFIEANWSLGLRRSIGFWDRESNLGLKIKQGFLRFNLGLGLPVNNRAPLGSNPSFTWGKKPHRQSCRGLSHQAKGNHRQNGGFQPRFFPRALPKDLGKKRVKIVSSPKLPVKRFGGNLG